MVVILPPLALIAVLTYGFFAFDQLVRSEYEQHRPAWEADGRPAGFFWRAKECGLVTSNFARIGISFGWLFRTPTWIASTPTLALKLRHFRFAVLVWNSGILAWWEILYWAAHGLHR